MTIADATIWLGCRQLEMYRKFPGDRTKGDNRSDQMVYIDAFCGGAGMRQIIGSYYKMLTKRGEIVYLEVLQPEVKKELKEMALDFSKGRLDSEGALNLCQLLHILSHESLQ